MGHHAKSTKAMLDKSDQERSHQEPGSVDSRTTTTAACTYPPHPFGRPGDGRRLMSCDRILETVALAINHSNHTSVGCSVLVNPDFRFVYLVAAGHVFHGSIPE